MRATTLALIAECFRFVNTLDFDYNVGNIVYDCCSVHWLATFPRRRRFNVTCALSPEANCLIDDQQQKHQLPIHHCKLADTTWQCHGPAHCAAADISYQRHIVTTMNVNIAFQKIHDTQAHVVVLKTVIDKLDSLTNSSESPLPFTTPLHEQCPSCNNQQPQLQQTVLHTLIISLTLLA